MVNLDNHENRGSFVSIIFKITFESDFEIIKITFVRFHVNWRGERNIFL